MAATEKEDPEQVRAALILVNLRDRKLRSWPEWVPMQPPRAASSSSPPGTVAAAKAMPPSCQASSSAGTAAAKVVAPLPWRPDRVISMQSGEPLSSLSLAGTAAARVVAPLPRRPDRVISKQSGELLSSLSLAGTVAVGVPSRWPRAKRSASRGETSKALPGQSRAAAAAAAKGSGEQERCAEMPAAESGLVVAALCYAAVVGSGAGPSTSAAPANKEPMKTPSPNSPLDYGAGGSGAPSSADDAAPGPARPQAKRKGTGDDEGCSSPAKRGPVGQEEEKSMPISVEPSVQSETRASSGKGAPRPFDLNLLPCALDDDDDGCPSTN